MIFPHVPLSMHGRPDLNRIVLKPFSRELWLRCSMNDPCKIGLTTTSRRVVSWRTWGKNLSAGPCQRYTLAHQTTLAKICHVENEWTTTTNTALYKTFFFVPVLHDALPPFHSPTWARTGLPFIDVGEYLSSFAFASNTSLISRRWWISR